jgi:uncharacterized peroxidase-related enzyme
MAYIKLEDHLPGITGLLEYRQDTAQPIRELTQYLLRGASSLSEAERELIATVVSNGNTCTFCTAAHTAAADHLIGEKETSLQVKQNFQNAPLNDKMKALLNIADLTRQSGMKVSVEAVNLAKSHGATDIEIHDTVLIAAVFCLYNRYVDGLGTALPENTAYYEMLATRLVEHGYTRLPQGYNHLKKH